MVQIIRTHSSSAKQRRKKKPNKETRELLESHAKLLAKWANVPKWAWTSKHPQPKLKVEAPKPVARPPSRVTPGGSTALKPVPRYTGDKLIGITVVHKSGLQPVFTQEQAEDAAKMRR